MKEVTLRMGEVEYRNLKRIIQQQQELAKMAIDQSGDTAQGESIRMAAEQAIDMCEGLLAQMMLQEIAEEYPGPHAINFARSAKTGEDIEEDALERDEEPVTEESLPENIGEGSGGLY